MLCLKITALQKQLEEEIDLHLALTSAVDHSNVTFLNSIGQLPNKAHELVTNIDVFGDFVSKLEEELVALHFQLSQERNEHRLVFEKVPI
ncbi:hypothetical protein IFM89_034712 [Coptis chinensis]|uniref:Ternary complex factor MIP1 leucine-zipper domain-containing protein n=1 Tax=Coptis chinensis TaxID=261450 RepID=A0A835LKA6_9MAGN|nr:hypothetical protein IFM89_034712 [Coptis chinensis]